MFDKNHLDGIEPHHLNQLGLIESSRQITLVPKNLQRLNSGCLRE